MMHAILYFRVLTGFTGYLFLGYYGLLVAVMSTCVSVTTSSVSNFQNLDLCVAYHCVAVTLLHLQVVLLLNKDYTESCWFVSFPQEYSGGYSVPERSGGV